MKKQIYIERNLESEILEYLNVKEIIAILGTRQCGKTTMINNFLDRLKSKKINRISFDNIKDLQLFENDIDSFIEKYVEGYDILFIDEVQYSKDSGKKLKYIYDNFKIKIFISGSSAAEISIQSLKYLVGRILIFQLYPFSFKEFLRSKNKRMVFIYNKAKYGLTMIRELNNYLEEFLLYGGYPRVVLAKKSEEKIKILNSIYNTYLLKEIREILDLSENDKLISLLKALTLQIGNIINYNELSSLTGFSYLELKRYINILEKTYICKQVKPFFTNKRTELVKTPKIYFFDLGFRNSCIDNFSKERSDKAAIYENFVFSELKKRNLDCKFWRTKSGAEVDFILEKNTLVIPLEIKSNLKTAKLTKSFNSFLEKYKPKKGYIFSLDFEDKKRLKQSRIFFKPFVKLNTIT